MAGLSLISSYCSDSEAANTDDDDDQVKEILPLPASIASWTGVSHHEEIQNDPSAHNGKRRTFQHVRGNWATLVYVDYMPGKVIQAWMDSVVDSMPPDNRFLLEEFHISISRTLVLKYHWIESFVDALKTLCQATRSFVVEFTDVAVYLNEEKSRTFLSIRCRDNSGTLNHLTKDLDKLLAEYDLPPFYKDASYHVSFAWSLGDQEERLQKLLPSISTSYTELLAQNIQDNHLYVNKLSCKIGNKLYAFPLR